MKPNSRIILKLMSSINVIILTLYMLDDIGFEGDEFFRLKKYFCAIDFYRKGLKRIYREYVKFVGMGDKRNNIMDDFKKLSISNTISTKVIPLSEYIDKKIDGILDKRGVKEKMEEEMG
ncbi:hypothetical protein SLOPH_1000, partial [Spraguea lophii 42_110]